MTTRKKASDEATFFICWTLKKTVSRLEDDDGQAVSTLFSHDGTEGFAGIRFPHWEFWFHVHFLSARSLPPFPSLVGSESMRQGQRGIRVQDGKRKKSLINKSLRRIFSHANPGFSLFLRTTVWSFVPSLRLLDQNAIM